MMLTTLKIFLDVRIDSTGRLGKRPPIEYLRCLLLGGTEAGGVGGGVLGFEAVEAPDE